MNWKDVLGTLFNRGDTMSKLTLEEAIDILTNPSADDGLSLDELHEAFNMGAEALRFKERHRWRDIKKDKPPTKGGYLVWLPPHGDYLRSEWLGDRFDEPGVSHWTYPLPLDAPEVEDEAE